MIPIQPLHYPIEWVMFTAELAKPLLHNWTEFALVLSSSKFATMLGRKVGMDETMRIPVGMESYTPKSKYVFPKLFNF